MTDTKNKRAKKSGNPAVRATAPSSAADFKKNRGGLITLPSGLVVKANRAGGLRAFVNAGTIPNSLMGLLDQSLNKDKGQKPVAAEQILGKDGQMDPKMLEDMLSLTDRIVIQVVVDPKIHPLVWTTEDCVAGICSESKVGEVIADDERDEDEVYIDEVEDEDKMFIFQWVTGGTTDVERFRQESAGTLDDLAGRAVALGSTE